jgi:predicted  nucleic acid-binding Zn-ribbon protein|tara:strand:+ start:241 stop:561 length:321 start_codon:yes stop_codon:yes gene_type:complete
MSKDLITNATEIAILQKNLKDLQSQLGNAHKRILELGNDNTLAVEELAKERQLLLELKQQVKKKEIETSGLIEKQMEDFPEILDSKPKTFSQPPQPGYQVFEDSKE